MKDYIIARLKEPSTWRGLIALATVLGWRLNPDQAAAIVTAGVTLIGLVGVFTPDGKKQAVIDPMVGTPAAKDQP